MATMKNLTARPIALPTGHVAPQFGTLTTTNDVLRCPDNSPTVNAHARSGAVQVDFDPEVDDLGQVQATVSIEPTPEMKAQLEAEAQLAAAAAENLAAQKAAEKLAAEQAAEPEPAPKKK